MEGEPCLVRVWGMKCVLREIEQVVHAKLGEGAKFGCVLREIE